MRYVGSKNKISKEIVTILQNIIEKNKIETYIEPFVGGANIIDKINCKNKIGYDANKYLIALLNKAKYNIGDFPERILLEEYNNVKENFENYDDWYIGLVGFCSSFGAKFFGRYARDSKLDESGKWSFGAINNLKKQSINFKNINFINLSYDKINIGDLKNCLIYCDPPYRNTLKYKKVEEFNYDFYYNWVKELSKNNIVICSEYYMPEEFICIWKKQTKVLIDSNKKKSETDKNRIEKLFIYKDSLG